MMMMTKLYSCFVVCKWNLILNRKMSLEGWLSTLCRWEAAIYTLDQSWNKIDVKKMIEFNAFSQSIWRGFISFQALRVTKLPRYGQQNRSRVRIWVPCPYGVYCQNIDCSLIHPGQENYRYATQFEYLFIARFEKKIKFSYLSSFSGFQ